MGNMLTDKEIKKLSLIGDNIIGCLECNINGHGIPCRTDRLEAVRLMKNYLEIHNYKVIKK